MGGSAGGHVPREGNWRLGLQGTLQYKKKRANQHTSWQNVP